MTVTTYGTLQSRVLTNVIDQPTAITTAVPDLINQAISDLQDDHNFKVCRAVQLFTTTALTRLLGTMPDNFMEFVTNERPYWRALDGSVTEINMLPSEDQAFRIYSYDDTDETGPPEALSWDFTDVGDAAPSLKVWPFSDSLSDWTAAPAGEYRIYIPYYGSVADLAEDADTNWFTNNGAPYIEHYATGLAFQKNWDQNNAQLWFTTAATFRDKIIKHDNALRTSQTRVLIPRSDVNASVFRVRF